MGWLRRLRATIAGSHVDDTIDEEVRLHLELRTEELIRDGMPPKAARREAGRRFGNVTLTRERARDADTLLWLADAGRDLRYGIRALRRDPGFAVAAVLMLALGIGANTAIYSIIRALLLRPLPVPHAEQHVQLFIVRTDQRPANAFSYPFVQALARRVSHRRPPSKSR